MAGNRMPVACRGAGIAGQYDRDLMCCSRPFDESERELATRTTPEARTQTIGNLLRGNSTLRSRRVFRGRVDELTVSYAVAETDVHARVRHP